MAKVSMSLAWFEMNRPSTAGLVASGYCAPLHGSRLFVACHRLKSRIFLVCDLYVLQKIKSILIRLVSSANTGYIYATTKNPTNIQHKLAFMKYDPIVRQHVLFTEAKMPKSRGGRRAGK